MENYFCLDCGANFEFDPETMNTCCQLCESSHTTPVVYEDEDFLVYKENDNFYIHNNGNIPKLIVEIDDFLELNKDMPDYWAYDITFGDAKMVGDVEYQLQQLEKRNYSTFSEEAFWETYPNGELQNQKQGARNE